MANSANIIKIKRSSTANKPSTLYSGELAYSYGTTPGTSPERLFFGSGDDGNGNATRIDNIGGLYYTRLIDASSAGTLTTNASSIPILSATGTINDWKVGNLELTGNTLSTTNGNLNVILSANGTGKVQINTSTNSFTLPASRTSTSGYVLTANTDGSTSWAASASALTLKADTLPGSDTSETINLLTDTLNIAGDSAAISTTVTVTGTTNKTYKTAISARLATTSLTGVAKFDSSTFSVDGYGNVTVSAGGISNTQLANSSLYIGTTLVTLGDASGTTTSLGVDISGNAGTVTDGVYTTGSYASPSWITSINYNILTGTVPTWNQDTTGQAGKVANALSNGNNIQSFTYDGSSTQSITLATDLTDVNSISSSSGTGPVTLNASGGHSYTFNTDGTVTFNSAYTFPSTVAGGAGYVLTDAAGNGTLSWAQPASSLSIPASSVSGDSQSAVTLNLLTDSLTFAGDSTININETSVASGSGFLYTYTATIADGAIGNSKLANSSITVNGTSFALGDSHTITANTTNALTFATTGGASPSSTFDGSSAVTIDYSTVGAAPSAGSSDIVTVGTITSGVWHGSTIDNSYLTNSTIYIGTTQVTLGDASGTTSSLAVNISGKASTAGTADQVAKLLTFSDSGGVALNATYNGSAAKTIDYSSVGAAPKAGSSDIVTVGTLTSGSIGAGFTAIANARLANSKVTVGTTDISLGSSSTTLAGLTQVDINNIRITGNTISSTDTDGNVVLDPNGAGTVNVSSARITNLADPTSAQDAATKAYVDATRSGLDVKDSVRAATTGNITLSNTQTVDGIALAVDNRVLVKNQDTASENGLYVVKSGAWIRATDADNSPAGEVTSGMFTFVEQGTVNADSGWVLTTDGDITLDTTSLTFVQFSGAGQITAGDGLSKTGNRLDVNVANGIEIVGDNVQLASTVAGDGLTYTSGVINVVGTTDRISVSADAIDISTSYIGQSSITTLGTITSGTWHGNTITEGYGGTGQTSYAKGDILYASATNTLSKLTAGTDGMVLQQQGGVPTWAYMDGGTY